MHHESLQELALDASAFKANVTSALESLARRVESLAREVKEMQGVTQGIQLEAKSMAVSARYTAEILEKHFIDDMKNAEESRQAIESIQKTIWKAAGGLAALMAVISFFGPKLLTFMK